MAEREYQNPETVNIHERGGLTQAHWEVVLNTFKEQGRAPWIVQYAQAAIDGRILDTNYELRNFLGANVWAGLEDHLGSYHYQNRDRQDIPDVLLKVEETMLYAFLEKQFSQTLSDFLYPGTPRGSIKWDELNKRWSKTVTVGGRGSVSYITGDIGHGEQPVPVYSKDYEPGELRNVAATQEDFYDHYFDYYLLKRDEVPNIRHTSPAELVSLARQIAEKDVEKIKNRIPQGQLNSCGKILAPNYIDVLRLFRKYGIDIANEREVGQALQKVYQDHYGILPFVIIFSSEGSRIVHFEATREAAGTEESLHALIKKPQSKLDRVELLCEGNIEKNEQIPAIHFIFPERPIPQAA